MMGIMSGHNKKANEAVSMMASQAGATPAEFKSQLRTTAMFYTPAEAAAFVKSADLGKTMEYVRSFSFDKGLYGDGAPTKDLVGIQLGDGSIIGDKNNVKLRFVPDYMQMAAEDKL
jgi:NitT/TauT family transport system substrate-binding protein